MRPIFFYLFFLLIFPSLEAQQYFTGLASRWSDDFSEWDIYTEADEDATGALTMRWQSQQDWNTWDFEVDGERGFIRTIFKDDPSKWELVGPYNEVITMRRLWSNDKREWRITDNSTTLTFKSRWGNRLDEWIIREESHGDFHIYTRWEGDPRDWTIIDELDEEISTSMKMAMLFLALMNTVF